MVGAVIAVIWSANVGVVLDGVPRKVRPEKEPVEAVDARPGRWTVEETPRAVASSATTRLMSTSRASAPSCSRSRLRWPINRGAEASRDQRVGSCD